ncbi:transcription factor HES-1-B [Patella vulgata]|uniref:transcription factor HES-1-B n=1 Tax=Patella vulgata TaxID=6465 RepID=UPI00217FC7A7|nr:transcription factor HES-1-B [Patella vulgata]
MTESMTTPTRPGPYNRRTNKPLVEKRRRARINDCLGELKTLVLQAMKQDSAQISRLEKADILEMTVKYLHHVQRQQPTSSMVNTPQSAAKYRAGFTECASEVMRYMSNIQGVNPEVSTKLTGHLAGCLSMVNSATQMAHVRPREMTTTTTVVPPSTPSPVKTDIYNRPLQIQIPDNKLKVSRDCKQQTGHAMLLMPINPQLQPLKSVTSEPHVVSPVRHVSSSFSYNGLKNITNTYVSPSPNSLTTDVKKQRLSFSPDSRSPSGSPHSTHSLAPKHLYDPISPVYSPPQCSFQEEKLWRPW